MEQGLVVHGARAGCGVRAGCEAMQDGARAGCGASAG